MGVFHALLETRAAWDLGVLYISLVTSLVDRALTDVRVTRHLECVLWWYIVKRDRNCLDGIKIEVCRGLLDVEKCEYGIWVVKGREFSSSSELL